LAECIEAVLDCRGIAFGGGSGSEDFQFEFGAGDFCCCGFDQGSCQSGSLRSDGECAVGNGGERICGGAWIAGDECPVDGWLPL
jgi:hypothetical protein